MNLKQAFSTLLSYDEYYFRGPFGEPKPPKTPVEKQFSKALEKALLDLEDIEQNKPEGWYDKIQVVVKDIQTLKDKLKKQGLGQ